MDCNISVTRATTDEWPQIAALRDCWNAINSTERIPVPPAAYWLVALAGTQVLAACAVIENELNGRVIYITDFYRVPSRTGKLGAKRLLDYLDTIDARLTGLQPVWNYDFLKLLTHRGWYFAEIRLEKDNRVRAL